MKKRQVIRQTLLAMAIAALGASGTALAVGEEEPNDDFGRPQQLEIGAGGIITVYGAINNPSTMSPDVDYYSFEGQQDDVVTLDIDGTTGGLDTVLHLFSPTGIMKLMNRNTDPADAGSNPVPGSAATLDASLQFKLDSPGTWKIAVTADPAFLTHQGAWLRQRAFTNGSYVLIVSGLKPAIQYINIDIKPGSSELAPINPKAKGTIPVALLSDSEFDPFEVEEASLKFGRMGNEASFRRCAEGGADFNRDGRRDRICHFDSEKTDFRRGDTVGVLKGTKGGKPFEGRGDLKVVPESD